MRRSPHRFRHIRLWGIAALLVWLAWTPASAEGQDVKVQGLVSETTVGADEVVDFTLEISGVSFADVETPEPPVTEGLVLAQSIPTTQRNITFINGAMQQSIAFQWRFRPLRKGTARFMPVTLTVKGRIYTTEEIRVSIVSQSQRPQRRPADPFANPFGGFRDAPDDAEQSESRIGDEDIFIRAVPSALRAYQNEQVTIEYQLFFRNYIQPRHSRLADSWDAEGFWREELDVEARPMPRAAIENGLRYNTIVLKRVAVFPTRSGMLTVDPLRIETEVFAPRSASDPFGRLFSMNNPYETIERASPPIAIESRPLPDGAPAGFRGAVGQFDMNSEVSRIQVEVGEPVQVTVRLSGSGNLAMIEPPPLQAPGVFEAYDPEVNLEINSGGQRVRGVKTFTYLLVPRSNGVFEVPPLAFPYFDPRTETYRTLRSNPVTLRVTGAAGTPVAATATAAGLPVDDIALPFTAADWQRIDPTPLYRSPWTYIVLALPLLLLGLLFGYRRQVSKLETDQAYARSRRAHPVARQHLKQAEALLESDEPRAFFVELERAVLGFVGNRLNVAELALTRPQLDARLAEAGLSADLRDDLRRLLETCDEARFAPDRPTPARLQAALDQGRRLLIALDTAFSQTRSSSV